MAMMIHFDSRHGLARPLYWRLNNFDQLGNREPDGSRVPAIARFRGYVSEAAFRAGKHFLDETTISFIPSSSSADLAGEAYAALKAHDPSASTAEALAQAKDTHEQVVQELAKLQAQRPNVAERLRKAGEAKGLGRAEIERRMTARGSPLHRLEMNIERVDHELSGAAVMIERAEAAHNEAAARRKAILSAKDV